MEEQSNAVERVLAHVDGLLELQRKIDEYERFLGDLTVMLMCPEKEHRCIQHNVELGDFIWRKVEELIKENRELKKKG
jgi:hypothetical protein